jgi:hypothetical protein
MPHTSHRHFDPARSGSGEVCFCLHPKGGLHRSLSRRTLVDIMHPVKSLVSIFIDVFGITRPTPQQEARATTFISVMLLLTLMAFLLFAYGFFHGFHR